MIDSYEQGDTTQFTFTSSVAPDSAPLLIVTGVENTAVASITSITSDSTHYYALFTMPNTAGQYQGRWYAQKTMAGSAYDFNKRFLFNVINTIRR